MRALRIFTLLLVSLAALPVLAQTPEADAAAAPAGAATTERPEALTFTWKQVSGLFSGFAGIPMWALVACCVLTTTLVVERIVVLKKSRVAPAAFTTRFLERLKEVRSNPGAARELVAVCKEHDSPVARLLAVVVENSGRSAFEIRTAVGDVADTELFPLRKHIRALGGLAALAPLLGLFGTVIGMIDAFHALSQQTGTGRAELLASGISLALIATASGLGVAILASVFYYYLQGRIDQRIQDLDLIINEAVMIVASDVGVREATPKLRVRGASASRRAAETRPPDAI